MANKHNEKRFINQIKEDYLEFSSRLQIHDIQIMPISALKDDMVKEKGNNYPSLNSLD